MSSCTIKARGWVTVLLRAVGNPVLADLRVVLPTFGGITVSLRQVPPVPSLAQAIPREKRAQNKCVPTCARLWHSIGHHVVPVSEQRLGRTTDGPHTPSLLLPLTFQYGALELSVTNESAQFFSASAARAHDTPGRFLTLFRTRSCNPSRPGEHELVVLVLAGSVRPSHTAAHREGLVSLVFRLDVLVMDTTCISKPPLTCQFPGVTARSLPLMLVAHASRDGGQQPWFVVLL